MRLNQAGFSALEVAFALIVIGLVGGTGAYVVNANKSTTDKPVATETKLSKTSQAAAPAVTDNQINNLAGGTIRYSLPKGWEVASHQATTRTRCYQTIDAQSACLDVAVLVLQKEGLTNADQFQVVVSVFDKNNNKAAKDWFNTDMADGDDIERHYTDFLSTQGLMGFKYVAPYENEQRTTYGLATQKYGVTVYADLFKGDNYSFKTSNDYTVYAPDVETIAKSIVIKQ